MRRLRLLIACWLRQSIRATSTSVFPSQKRLSMSIRSTSGSRRRQLRNNSQTSTEEAASAVAPLQSLPSR